MGCGASQEKKNEEIDYHMEYIRDNKFNDLFSTCENVLTAAEDLRSGWEDSMDTMYEIASINFLKKPGNLADAMTVWVWAISSGCNGDITKFEPKITKSSPYLEINLPSACPAEVSTFSNCMKKYIQTSIEGAKTLPELIDQLAKLIEQAKVLKDNGMGAFSQLSLVEKGKEASKIGKNIGKIQKGLVKLKSFVSLLPETANNLTMMGAKIPEILKTAKEMGQKANTSKYMHPSEIMEKMYPAEKFSTAELAEIKQKQEKQKKLKAEEEQKKKTALQKFIEEKKALIEKYSK